MPKHLKFMMVGDRCCGKTSLLTKYSKKTLVPTGLQCCTFNVEIERKQLLLEIWDNGDDLESVDLKSLLDTDVVLLCYSIIQPETLVHIIRKWNPKMKRLCPNAEVMLVGNKTDLRNEKNGTTSAFYVGTVYPENARAMARKIGAIAHHQCSAVTGVGVKDVFEHAIEIAILSNRDNWKSCTVL